MKAMTVIGVPSVYEPLGMVPLEAMACGVAVVDRTPKRIHHQTDDDGGDHPEAFSTTRRAITQPSDIRPIRTVI